MRRNHRLQRTAAGSLTPLLVPEGATRRLASFIVVLSILMATLGGYGLVEAIHHPLEAQAGEVIGGAVMIALAAIMIFYLVEPLASAHAGHRRQHTQPHRQRYTVPQGLIIPVSHATQENLRFGPDLGERTSAGD